MKLLRKGHLALFRAFLFLAVVVSLRAGDLDTIGVVVLRQVDPTLTGSGVKVAHVEAPLSTNSPPPFEVNPANPTVNRLANLFTYISDEGTATTYPNSVGVESGHANAVAANFYGIPNGVATNVAHVDNYEANYFYNNVVGPLLPPTPAIPAKVVNQSFIFDISDETIVNQNYDNYAASHGTLFVSGIGNGDVPVSPSATSFNGIGVGAYGSGSSAGPTADGRSKPDITAPGGATSYSTPYVAGAAAILMQASARGDGGANTNTASDLRTIKALLLDGAIKPGNWTNGVTTPLDARYGAGIVNVFNSWMQLSGGPHSFIESTSYTSGDAHPPGVNTNDEPVLVGWDFNSISTLPTQDQVNHYYFNLPVSLGNSSTLTTTLVWNRQSGQVAINDLNLFLYDTSNSNLVASSVSTVDNVEHLWLPQLASGRYDLQVLKKGSIGQVSASETYALAFEIFSMRLNIALTNNNVVITWPVSPTGFQIYATASLNPPISWTIVNATVSIINNQQVVFLPVGGANQFFRLQRP